MKKLLLALLLFGCTPDAPKVEEGKSLPVGLIVPQQLDDVTPAHEHVHLPVALATKAKPGMKLAPLAAPLSTPTDKIPDFAGEPTITSVRNGAWTDPATWGGRVPGKDDVVRCEPGHTVTYSGQSNDAMAALGIACTLTMQNNSRIIAGTTIVYREGALRIGSAASPITGKVEFIVANRPLDVKTDPLRFGTGLIVFGELTIHGDPKRPTWERLAVEPKAGDTMLTLASAPYGWKVGDRLVLPDTRQTPLEYEPSTAVMKQIALQIEEPVVAGQVGAVITLRDPLRWDHLGGRDSDGALIALPHVGNLSRSVVLRSEDPKGTRGHILLTERAKVDIRYTEFNGLGRTTAAPLTDFNKIGRYPVHFHHLMGPRNATNTGYQFTFTGNAVNDALKWGIAVHNSHWGLVTDNVVYNSQGAGIMTEQGNERENVFDRNFTVKTGTPFAGRYDPVYGGTAGIAGLGRPLGFADHGWDGSGQWFTGLDNYVRNNVSANNAFAGFMYNARSPGQFGHHHPVVPRFRGADIAVAAEWESYRAPYRAAPSIRESSGNETYASAEGAWISFSGHVGTIRNMLLWNNKQAGVYSARNASVTFDGLTVISDQRVSNLNDYRRPNTGLLFPGGIYTGGQITIRNARVEGFNVGVILPGNIRPMDTGVFPGTKPVTVIDGAVLRNFINMIDASPKVAKTTLLRDVTFTQNPGPARQFTGLPATPTAIASALEPNQKDANIVVSSRLFSFNHNKSGQNVQYFFPEQAPGYVMSVREYPKGVFSAAANCPTQGLTNQQCWDQHKIATLGQVATCSDVSPGIRGFACKVEGSPEICSPEVCAPAVCKPGLCECSPRICAAPVCTPGVCTPATGTLTFDGILKGIP